MLLPHQLLDLTNRKALDRTHQKRELISCPLFLGLVLLVNYVIEVVLDVDSSLSSVSEPGKGCHSSEDQGYKDNEEGIRSIHGK